MITDPASPASALAAPILEALRAIGSLFTSALSKWREASITRNTIRRKPGRFYMRRFCILCST